MGWLMSGLILSMLTLSSFYETRVSINTQDHEEVVSIRQRAIETINYINAIDDYFYNRDIPNGEFVLDNKDVGIDPLYGIKNVIFNKRIFVWQRSAPGLIASLKKQSSSSVLIGVVKNHRLIDGYGVDMGVVVPASIPSSSIVYLN